MHPVDHVNRHFSKNSSPAVPFQQMLSSYVRQCGVQHEPGSRGVPYTKIQYFNYSGVGLLITRRDGSSFSVPRRPDPNAMRVTRSTTPADQIIVAVTNTMSRDQMEQAYRRLSLKPRPWSDDTAAWIKAYDHTLYHNPGHGDIEVQASIEYVLTQDDLVGRCAGRAYLVDLDVLIESADQAVGAHPYDSVSRTKALMQDLLPDVSAQSAAFMFKAVDNSEHPRYTTRYFNMGGLIYAIHVERDLKYGTGIHVVAKEELDNDRDTGKVITRSYTFEEADKKFGLHTTVEEAVNGGPISDRAKHLLEEEVTRKRLEESRIRGEQLTYEREIQIMRNRIAANKIWQEKEQSARRNWLDWVKTGISLLGAVVTLIGIVQKLKTA